MAGQQIDVLASLALPDGQPYSVMIECKYHGHRSAGNADVQSIALAYSLAKTQNLVQACAVVSSTEFSEDAQIVAKKYGVHLVTSNQLLRLTNAIPGVNAYSLRQRYRQMRAATPYFIPGHAHRYSEPAISLSVGEFLSHRAASAPNSLTVLFGGLGTGKTTHLVTLSEQLTTDYLAGAPSPVALYIPLERFTRHRHAEYFDDFVVGYLRSQFRMPEINWTDIAEWLATRAAVLILDGFDEIPHLGSETAIEEEFDHILTTVGSNAATIMSCRTTLAARTSQGLPALFTERLTQLNHIAPEIVEIDLFSHEELVRYVNTAGGSRRLLNGQITPTILRRPVLLNLVVGTLRRGLRSNQPSIETAPELLEYCIMLLLRYRTNLRQAGLPAREWRTFVEECALQMMLEDLRQITPARLTEMVRQYFRDDDKVERLAQLDFDASVRTVFDFDLRNGGLRWSHHIFRDYLAAGAIARRLVAPQLADRELDGHQLTREMLEFVRKAVQRREKEWKLLGELRRPLVRPRSLGPSNDWCWISPGLSVLDDPEAGSRLAFFKEGYWISKQPIMVNDLGAIGTAWMNGNLSRYRRASPMAAATHISHDEAMRLASTLGGCLRQRLNGSGPLDGSTGHIRDAM